MEEPLKDELALCKAPEGKAVEADRNRETNSNAEFNAFYSHTEHDFSKTISEKKIP